MNDLHIVTVATESKYYFPYLIESCKKYGKELEVLGYGEKWLGFNWKFKKMLEYLNQIPENDIVCFVDGYDVLCLRELNEMKKEFIRLKEKYNCKIIVAEDKTTNTLFTYIGSIIFGQCKGININSGTYIGYAKDLLIILEDIYTKNPDNKNDDQMLLTEHCINNDQLFHIDTESELFFTQVTILGEISDYITIKNNEVIARNNKPFFIHVPHGFLDKLIIELGYDYNNIVRNDILFEIFTNKLWKGALANYILFLIFCIFIIIFIYVLIKYKVIKYSIKIPKIY
uniref:PLOD1-3-like GT domain-containing protein n=1 Tax=viral metagenome TaxID=1070528 RepID=A0A6C0D3Q9_9ZZZZ